MHVDILPTFPLDFNASILVFRDGGFFVAQTEREIQGRRRHGRVKQAITAFRRTRRLPERGWKSQMKAGARKLLNPAP